MTTEMVDWQLAVTLGSRLAGSGPVVSPDEAAATVAELRGGRRPLDGVRARVHRPRGGRADGAGPRRRPPGLDPGQRRRLRHAPLPGDRQDDRAPGHARRRSPRPSAPGSPAAEVGGLLGFMSSRVLGQFDPFHEPERPAAAGRAQRRPRRARARRRPRPTSGSGSACTRRPTACSSPRCRGCATTSSPRSGGSAETVEPQRLLDDGFKRISEAIRNGGKGGSLLDLMGTPEQKEILERVTAVMSLLEGHADVVMDGVGPEVIPTVGAIRRRFDERRQGVGTLDRLPAQAARPRRQDGAVPRRRPLRPRRRRQGRDERVQRRLGRAGEPPVEDRDRRPRHLDRPGPAGLTEADVSLHPSVAAVRHAVRRGLADLDPGARLVVACSGGADSLALASATVFEGRDQGWYVVGATVDHGLQEGSDAPRRRRRRAARHARRRRDGHRARHRRGPGLGPEAAARAARYAVLEQLRESFDADLVLLGHTRDDQAETVLLGLTRGSGGRALAGMRRCLRPLPPAAARRLPHRHRHGLPGRGPPDLGGPPQRRPGVHPGPGPPPGAADARGRARARASPTRWPGRPSSSGPTWSCSTPTPSRRALPRPSATAGSRSTRSSALPGPIRTRVLQARGGGRRRAGGRALPPARPRPSTPCVTDWHGQKWVDLPGHLRAVRRDGLIAFEHS